MIKLRFLPATVFTITLAACGVDEPQTPPVSKPVLKSVSPNKPALDIAAKKAAATAAFQSACRDKITAKMPDPSAAKISYSPLSGADGFQAELSLVSQGSGSTLKFNYNCIRNASGGVTTQRIGD